MTTNIFDQFRQAADVVAETAHNMNDTTSGGGGGRFKLLETGNYYGYLIHYVEEGNHVETVQGKPDGTTPYPHFSLAIAVFPHDEVLEDGSPNPEADEYVIVESGFPIPLKTGERSNAVKIFRGLEAGGGGGETHIAQFLGAPRQFRIEKKKSKSSGREYNSIIWENTALALEGVGRRQVAMTLPSPDPSDIRAFFWEAPTKEEWDKLYIEPREATGERRAVANFIQNRIVGALNFEGSPLEKLLGKEGFDFEAAHAALKAEPKTEAADLVEPDEGEDEAPAPAKAKPPRRVTPPARPTNRRTPPAVVEPEDDEDEAPWDEDEDIPH